MLRDSAKLITSLARLDPGAVPPATAAKTAAGSVAAVSSGIESRLSPGLPTDEIVPVFLHEKTMSFPVVIDASQSDTRPSINSE